MAKTKQLGKVEPELNERITNYSKLIGISKTDLLEELFNKEVEDKVLTNDFIEVDEIYYFNLQELLKDHEVKAAKDKPTTNLNDVFIVKKVPNNLDSFDKVKRTFCYNGAAEKHLGIYSYNRIDLNLNNVNETKFYQYIIIFEYDSKTEELVLKLTKPEEIPYLFNVENAEEVIEDLTSINKEYSEAKKRVEKLSADSNSNDLLTFSEEGINLGLYLSSLLVIESLTEAKGFSWSLLKNDPEAYEKLKGKYNSGDLAIFRNVKIVKPEEEDEEYIAIPSNTAEGGSKNGS